MTFKKLALAAVIASVPVAGFSLESLEDATLSGVTGQDGIQIQIDTPVAGISGDIIVHDRGGFAGAASDGAIRIDNFALVTGVGGIGINIDAGDQTVAGAAGTATLNVAVSIPTGTSITTGAIQVGNSGRDDVTSNWDSAFNATVMNSATITLGATTLNIQLGNELQDAGGAATASTSHMIALSTTITGGISMANFALNDVNSTGSLGAANVLIADNNNATTQLAVGAVGINVTGAGLVVEVGSLGSATGIDMLLTDAYLGTSTDVIGDVSILGLNLNGTTITISGKP